MKKNLLKLITVTLLIITLTMANFMLLGVNVYTYAVDTLTKATATNNKNVTFDAYIKDASGAEVESAQASINSDDLKLVLQIQVKNEGYFNGGITLNNSNFKLKIENDSDKINKIEENTITLNQINSGENVVLELGIEPVKQTTIDVGLLSLTSNVRIDGTYKDSTEKDIKIEAQREIQVIYESPYQAEEGAELTSMLLTNNVYNIEGENKRIVQVLVESNQKDNSYPIKSTNIEIRALESVENVTVTSMGTLATNGKEGTEFSKDNWKYNKEENKVSINIENKVENGKISWNQNAKDSFVVTYIMPNDNELLETQIQVNSSIMLYDTASTLKTASSTVSLGESKDGIITNGISTSEGSMYKGKIYAGEDRKYDVQNTIYINTAETGAKINVKMNPATYETATGTMDANSQYVSSKINKAEITKVLGENGSLNILNETGDVIATLNKDSNTDDDGNIEITYPADTKQITLESTEVNTAGEIIINSSKVIKASGYTRTQIASANSLCETTNTETMKIELKETTTAGRIETNQDSLSTVATNNVEIRAILQTNSEENDLYTNPTITITLPSQVESINVNSINLLYENELQLASARTIGQNTIEISLTGMQTIHKDETIEGTTIIINADLGLNKKATSQTEEIKMVCVNLNSDATLEASKPIEVVQPRGIITVNSMDDYGISSIGEEETKTAKIELGTKAKQSQVNIEMINNNAQEINDVKILGTYPTKSSENTIETTVTPIQVENAEVYYTENENATDDLLDGSNGWTQKFTSETNVKKYLITVDNIDVSGGISASYTLNVPGDLGYNEQAYENYEVSYINSLTGVQDKIKATTLGISTGKGPELTSKLTAKVGSEDLNSGDTVSTGEIIKYTLELENTGTETATNVQVKGDIPDGTKQVEKEQININDNITGESNYQEIENTEDFTAVLESIPAGEKATIEYEVKVSSDAEENAQIANTMAASYNDLETKTDEIALAVDKSDISVEVNLSKYLDTSVAFTSGEDICYYATISNLSSNDISDVELTWNATDNLTITHQTRINNFEADDEEIEELDVSKTITISEIEANSEVVICAAFTVNDDVKGTESANVSATIKANSETVSSNEVNLNVYGLEGAEITLTANNENGYLVDGDKITYKITAKNNNDLATSGALIEDEIPTELTILDVTINGESQTIVNKDDEEDDDGTDIDTVSLTNNTLTIMQSLGADESAEIGITTVVDKDESRTEATTITNKAELMLSADVSSISDDVSHILSASAGTDGDVAVARNVISGVAWFDKNEDGKRDSSEDLLEGITAMLIDTSTGNIATNNSGEECKTTTNSNGIYIFSEVPEGEYLVAFEYDTSKYVVTSYQKEGTTETNNSDAITKILTINGQEGTYGVTNTLTMSGEGISNIDIGLMTSTTFDLELNKYVSKIIVQNSKGSKTYEYDKSELAKVEIAAKQLSGSTVVIEYQIDVTNTGEVAGYVKNIADYVPTDLKFSSELNTNWYQSGENLYNASLANAKIEAGETKTLTLTLTKTMTEENTGLVNNTAEIAESYNESGIEDVDSVAGNKTQGEDDMGAADVIIGVKTGAMITYITLTISIITIIAIAAYYIGRRISKANEIKVNL